MTESQKIIKYIAIAFGFFLIISIFSSIFMVLNFFNQDSTENEITTVFKTKDNILELDIDVSTVDLIIKNGDKLIIETNNNYINCKQSNEKLKIKENKHNILKNKNNKLIITLPEDTQFNVFEMDTGVGKIDIDEINSRVANIELGAGKVDFESLNILKTIKIDGGAGEISINSGKLNNLDLDMGVGKITINSILLGNADIDAGVGELNINLLDSVDNYSIITSKGLGSISLNGKNITNVGNGENRINIDGGVGSINITTIER